MSKETHECTIRAFQKILPQFRFDQASSFSEAFAQDRYTKKMEVPDSSRSNDRKSLCWDNWIKNDESLPGIGLPLSEWYKARNFLHESLGQYRQTKLRFPKGSELEPTRGQNSVEARLAQSRWTCTYDNFDAFVSVCYQHKALKRAARRRYERWFRRKQFDITMKSANRIVYEKFRNSRNPGREIFAWKLSMVTTLVHGSRFSTVPKNNEKDRPINVEPFGNTLTQLQMGSWLRTEILRIFGLDLDRLADLHRIRIKDVEEIATIDLKDASDSISVELCRFLLPKRIFHKLQEYRSQMVLGLDRSYHMTKKISSMGNGFTFELMTLILLSVCKVLDHEATVFGDDIIIRRDKAARLIVLLSDVGLKVNMEKSFTDGPFRESCGGNYHQDEGYVESYDFHYPESIGDCVLVWNKVRRLSRLYPSFKKLRDTLYRSLPNALHGGPDPNFDSCEAIDLIGNGFKGESSSVNFPLKFVTDLVGNREVSSKIKAKLDSLCYDADRFRLYPGFEFKPELRSKTTRTVNRSRQWAKYEMYLASGRVSKDVITSRGEWVTVWFVASDHANFRVRGLDNLTLPT